MEATSQIFWVGTVKGQALQMLILYLESNPLLPVDLGGQCTQNDVWGSLSSADCLSIVDKESIWVSLNKHPSPRQWDEQA